MYRNCKCKKCCALNNNCNNYQNDMFEHACSNVYPVTEMENDCGCGFDEEDSLFPSNPMFGQTYIPWQTMNKTFTPCVGLKMGTIFPELVSPYMPGQSMEEIAYIRATNKIKEGCNKC